jgi:hypothetical protein
VDALGPAGWSLRVIVAVLTAVPLLPSTTTLVLGTERFDQAVAVNPSAWRSRRAGSAD